jgi:putative glutathione S-transferase
MKLMIDGIWRGDIDPTPELEAQRMIHAGSFRDRVTADGSSGFLAERDRYHLYISYACPFSHRVVIVHALKKLDSLVGLSVVHPVWDTPHGWVLGETALSTTDRGGNGFACLHEAYHASCANYTGKVLVPVLWDRKSRRIVNNESLEITKMLNHAFDAIGGDAEVDLYPGARRQEIDILISRITGALATGVYMVASARDQAEYDGATDELFAFLDACEKLLADGRRFVQGDQLTLADIVIFTPLVRFDAVYNPLFRAGRKRLIDYPRLTALVKRIYDLPAVADTVRFDHILTHYYDGDWAVARRRGIVPRPPDVDWRTT